MYSDARSALQGKLVSANLGLPIAWEGVKFTRPTNASWLAPVLITTGSSRFITLGPVRDIRKDAIFQIDVNTPPNCGTKAGDDLCDQLASLYIGQMAAGNKTTLTFFPSTARTLGMRDGFFTHILDIPFVMEYQERGLRTITASAVSFTGPQNGTNRDFIVPAIVIESNLQVYINGLIQPSTFYTVAKPTVTLSSPPSVNDVLEFFVW